MTEYLKFDPTSNSITLDSEKFKKDFSKLSNLSIQSRKSEIIPSGSLLQVYDG